MSENFLISPGPLLDALSNAMLYRLSHYPMLAIEREKIEYFYDRFRLLFNGEYRPVRFQTAMLQSCIMQYCECILIFVQDNFGSMKKDEADYLGRWLSVLDNLAGVDSIKNKFTFFMPILRNSIYRGLPSWVKKEFILHVNRIFEKSRQLIFSKKEKKIFLRTVESWFKLIITCGDYEFQNILVETIISTCELDHIQEVLVRNFGDTHSFTRMFLEVYRRQNYVNDLKTFLNAINDSFHHVRSVPCVKVTLEETVIPPLKGTTEDDTWLHINYGFRTFSFECQQDSLKSPPDSINHSNVYEFVTVNFDDIDKVCLLINNDSETVNPVGGIVLINLSGKCSCRFDSSKEIVSSIKKITLAVPDGPHLQYLKEAFVKFFGSRFKQGNQVPIKKRNFYDKRDSSFSSSTANLSYRAESRRRKKHNESFSSQGSFFRKYIKLENSLTLENKENILDGTNDCSLNCTESSFKKPIAVGNRKTTNSQLHTTPTKRPHTGTLTTMKNKEMPGSSKISLVVAATEEITIPSNYKFGEDNSLAILEENKSSTLDFISDELSSIPDLRSPLGLNNKSSKVKTPKAKISPASKSKKKTTGLVISNKPLKRLPPKSHKKAGENRRMQKKESIEKSETVGRWLRSSAKRSSEIRETPGDVYLKNKGNEKKGRRRSAINIKMPDSSVHLNTEAIGNIKKSIKIDHSYSLENAEVIVIDDETDDEEETTVQVAVPSEQLSQKNTTESGDLELTVRPVNSAEEFQNAPCSQEFNQQMDNSETPDIDSILAHRTRNIPSPHKNANEKNLDEEVIEIIDDDETEETRNIISISSMEEIDVDASTEVMVDLQTQSLEIQQIENRQCDDIAETTADDHVTISIPSDEATGIDSSKNAMNTLSEHNYCLAEQTEITVKYDDANIEEIQILTINDRIAIDHCYSSNQAPKDEMVPVEVPHLLNEIDDREIAATISNDLVGSSGTNQDIEELKNSFHSMKTLSMEHNSGNISCTEQNSFLPSLSISQLLREKYVAKYNDLQESRNEVTRLRAELVRKTREIEELERRNKEMLEITQISEPNETCGKNSVTSEREHITSQSEKSQGDFQKSFLEFIELPDNNFLMAKKENNKSGFSENKIIEKSDVESNYLQKLEKHEPSQTNTTESMEIDFEMLIPRNELNSQELTLSPTMSLFDRIAASENKNVEPLIRELPKTPLNVSAVKVQNRWSDETAISNAKKWSRRMHKPKEDNLIDNGALYNIIDRNRDQTGEDIRNNNNKVEDENYYNRKNDIYGFDAMLSGLICYLKTWKQPVERKKKPRNERIIKLRLGGPKKAKSKLKKKKIF